MSPSQPRTLLFSQRQFDRMVYQCGKYEFEDIIQEVDSIDLIAPSLKAETRLGRFHREALDRSRRRIGLLPSVTIEKIEIARSYELFFAAFLFPAEAGALRNLRGWRERSRYAACFLSEVWTKDVNVLRSYAPILRQFDHIFLHMGASRSLVESIVGRPCHLIHLGIDAIRFCPMPLLPKRVVDCYSFGRRIPAIHEALLKLTTRKQFFYVYDTVNNFAVNDLTEHRQLVAETAKRSRYLISYKHNLNMKNKTGGDEALASRLFEGIASGAILLGASPNCPEFSTCFDWPDAVVELPIDTSDVELFLSDLDAQVERVRQARKNNVLAALRRHDWVHRWATILRTMGISPLEGLIQRQERLSELARLAEKEL